MTKARCLMSKELSEPLTFYSIGTHFYAATADSF